MHTITYLIVGGVAAVAAAWAVMGMPNLSLGGWRNERIARSAKRTERLVVQDLVAGSAE